MGALTIKHKYLHSRLFLNHNIKYRRVLFLCFKCLHKYYFLAHAPKHTFTQTLKNIEKITKLLFIQWEIKFNTYELQGVCKIVSKKNKSRKLWNHHDKWLIKTPLLSQHTKYTNSNFNVMNSYILFMYNFNVWTKV